jgi:glycerol-3-phosphate dehydrogenase (NAD(P)+)
MNINIIGAGTWGTTIGCLLVNKNHNVTIWQRDENKRNEISSNRIHPHLSNYKIPNTIEFTSEIDQLDFKNLTILAVPSHALDDLLTKININNNTKLLIVSKGFEINLGILQTELLENKFNINKDNIAILSGPNHAEEIIIGKASASVVASTNYMFAKELQTLFSSEIFRVYTTKDVIGVQVGAAVKNVIAIASGLCVGLNLGDNTQAALVSRGMNEILLLDTIYDFYSRTLYGLSGLGDLVATCYSEHSRNRKLGILISHGMTIDEAKNEIGMVSEGINTCRILNKISINNNIEMPICNEVYNILFEGADPKDSIHKLMTRKLKVEN